MTRPASIHTSPPTSRHPSFFAPLERFAALAREAIPAAPDGVRPLLVYGGDRRQERSAGWVLPWRGLQEFPWTAV